MQTIDLDAASATPLRAEVRDAMRAAEEYYGNPSSMHAPGRAARMALDELSDRLAALLGRRPLELTFTGSATEAMNLGILGSLQPQDRVLCSAIEHHAALASVEEHIRRGGSAGYLAPDAAALVHAAAVEVALREPAALVVLMAANNEVGTVQPVEQVGEIARAHGARLLSDASAAAGALPLRALAEAADLLVLSAAKVGGPKGVGVLVAPEEPPLRPVIHGGGQQHRRRSGTESLPLIAGLVRALELAEDERVEESTRRAAVRDRLEALLRAAIPGLRIHGHPTLRLPGILHVGVPGVEAEALVLRLDREGIACSSGAACTTPMVEPSHVLAAMGLPPELVKTGVRFSLGRGLTNADIDRAAEVVIRVAAALG